MLEFLALNSDALSLVVRVCVVGAASLTLAILVLRIVCKTYFNYIVYGWKESIGSVCSKLFALSMILVVVVVLAIAWLPYGVLLSTAAIAILFGIAVAVVMPRACTLPKEEVSGPHKLDTDVEYYVVETPRIFASYCYKDRRIYVSSKLIELLEPNELKAVILHEAGHARLVRALRYLHIASIIASAWIALSLSISMVLGLALILSRASSFVLAMNYIATPAACIPAAIAIEKLRIVTSWIVEHEADVQALKYVSPEDLARALMKISIYERLGSYVRYVKSVNVRDEIVLGIILSPKIVRRIVMRSFSSHPPLELRIARVFTASMKAIVAKLS